MDQFPFTFGPYEVLAELGRGAASIVYKARDANLNWIVALKMLGRTASSEARQRFLREARVLAALSGESEFNIPTLHQVGEDRGQFFHVREFVDGGSLERLVTSSLISLSVGVKFLTTIARTIQRVHDRGIVHRNLHPANILIAADGTPKLTGFGLVGCLSDCLPPGTPGISAVVDIQALGRLLSWLCSMLHGSIPEPIQAICRNASAAGSAGGFASATEFADALASVPDPM